MDSVVNNELANAISITPEQASLIAQTLGNDRKKPIPLSPNWEVMLSLGSQYFDLRTKFYYYWLLLSGQRVSEALRLNRSDVSKQMIDGREYLMVDSITLKNQNRPRRIIPIPLFGVDGETAKSLWTTLQGMNPQDSIMNGIKRDTLAKRLAKAKIIVKAIKMPEKVMIEEELKIYPHFLRHTRATELASRDEGQHKMGIKELMQYFGWASSAMPNLYADLNPKNLARAVGQI